MGAGRPTKRTPEIIARLEEGFSLGSNTLQACFYADISTSTFYSWCDADSELKDRLNSLKQNPILAALQTVYADLDNINTAKWYLERRCSEFKPKQEVKADGDFQGDYLKIIRKSMSLDEATQIYQDNLQNMNSNNQD